MQENSEIIYAVSRRLEAARQKAIEHLLSNGQARSEKQEALVIAGGSSLIGHNVIGFDYSVLQPYADFDVLSRFKSKTLDTMVHIEKIVGIRLKLDSLARHTLGKGKTLSAVTIPALWKRGEHQKVKDYLINDLEILKNIYLHGKKYGWVKCDINGKKFQIIFNCYVTRMMQYTQQKNIEINDQFRKALSLMENTTKNVFITGRAGTGKSTLLDYFKKTTKKNIAVLAPTGVAAVNIGGQTIHSFFKFGPDITPDKVRKYDDNAALYNALEAIVIDEISMVRADLLDCVDKALKLSRSDKKPFGGMQIIFIGDLYQLSPVVTGKEREVFRTHYKSQYFFDSKAFNNLEMEMIELEKIYRQKDHKFINILNAIRNNSVTAEQLREINKRLHPNFEPKINDFYINLTTTNDMAYAINSRELEKLKSKLFIYRGRIKGSFDKKYLPTDIDLKVKIGSQVMLLNNDSAGRWVNGTVGKIADIRKKGKEDIIIVETQNREFVDVSPYTWKIYNMIFNKETESLDSEVLGSFTQYPIKLAWAVTIHKGQGKTFDRVIIDIGKGTFAHGQTYVALSRCTALDGIVLKKPIQKKHIFMDWKIVSFLTKYQYRQSEKLLSLEEKIRIIERAIKNESRLEIVYLKSSDEKSRRTILPKSVGKMEYMSRQYMGVEAYCFSRKDDRVFRVDRILEIKKAE